MSEEWQTMETAPRDGRTFLAYGECGFSLVTYQRPYRHKLRWIIVEQQMTMGVRDTLAERFITHWRDLPPRPEKVR